MKLMIEKLHAAAFYLTKHPDSTAAEVGEFIGASERTIHRWSTRDEWHTALDNLGYAGDRGWRRNVQRDVMRDSGDLVDLAKSIFLKARAEGITPGKAEIHTAKVVNCGKKTIYNWRRKFNWDDEL